MRTPAEQENINRLESDIQAYLKSGKKIKQLPPCVCAESPIGKQWGRDDFAINGVNAKKRFEEGKQ